ncbi:MAG: class I SAM-dependent methyltransferase [Anaerolineales bacterium]|nr:class I SAM-dependent methyltransferase [Anaerolineales bacterium]
MAINKEEFERLMNEAWQHEFTGWDFDFIRGRMLETEPSWDYRKIAADRIRDAKSLLDMDTGGGEFLASLAPLPAETCATEGHPPNVPVARTRLEPLGVKVEDTHAMTQLPFGDNSFDLVINRHGSFLAPELGRILKSGGRFVTQQVGGRNCQKLNEALHAPPDFLASMWTLDIAVRQLEGAGLRALEKKEEFPATDFKDIGAVVYYLKAISWQVSDFSIEKYYDQLLEIHTVIQETGKFSVEEHRFFIEMQKP